jgi:phospho-N-acetylmuramoyl-pentapeptide-transferase
MFWQVLLAGTVAVFLFLKPGFSAELFFPFFKRFPTCGSGSSPS